MATDPVCGMFVEERPSSLRLVRDNRTYYFCAESCRDQFADPGRAQRSLARRLTIAWPLSVAVVALTYGLGNRDALLGAAVLASVVQFWAGRSFYRGARDALVDRSWNMDVLIAVGSTTAYLYSLAVLLLPGRLPPGTYFDASSLIVTLILTGNYLEHLTRARAGSALQRLSELLPSTASVLRDGRERPTPISEVHAGDQVVVRPGARFPTDGVIREGATSVDESILTGEALPQARRAGDRVIAGSLNLDGLVTAEATAVGEDTFAAHVGALLSEAEMSRVPLQRTADRVASYFVPFVLSLATVAAIGWVAFGHADPTVGLLVFVSVVIIACPCAFGLATPAAIVVGTGRAAEDGVLFRGEDAIERAARVDLVVTDKTGTLTTGRPILADVRPVNGRTETELLTLSAALEFGSDHPFARAVVAAATAKGARLPPASEIRLESGVGIQGHVGGSLVEIRRAAASDPANALRDVAAEIEREGHSASVVLQDGRAVGVLGFSDAPRAGLAEAVASLRAAGISTVIATGDGAPATEAIARAAGIREVHTGLTPAAKLELVRRLGTEGHRVAFVGDGINDGPALAAAEVGIAVGSGTDVAREAGQVLLVRSEFSGVAVALEVARRTVAKVRGNFVWALGYNAVLLPIAAGALVPLWGFGVYAILPIAGAVAMAISSTLVVANSMSLRWIARPARAPARPTRA